MISNNNIVSEYKGKPVVLHKLVSGNGMCATITNFGARIVSLFVPDKEGSLRDVVQGFDRVEDYFPESHSSDFGAVIGRYANRIAGGRFSIEGSEYQLPQNNGPNCLHGGPMGWQYAVYDVVEATDRRLELSLLSPDGDNGFPGNVRVTVVYTLDDDNRLRIDYRAVTDRTTIINMTNHTYWNLNGDQCSPILNHTLFIDADQYTPVDETLIPIGCHDCVEGTPMDFRTPKEIGRDIESDFEQLHIGSGYDHNWVLSQPRDINSRAAVLGSPLTGIMLEVYTDAPGMQVYTGNFLDGVEGKGKVRYGHRSAVCLETQQYPDSPNHCWPESTGRLTPDRPFESTTIFNFLHNDRCQRFAK
ncbi:MAG: galactose mutarotase [Bacteroidales bacterium]|nr:galactose mutarotase [Bacteroidales bacterium]